MIVSESYTHSSNYQKQQICNGCGSHGFTGKLVPDVILGRCISDACNVHDWMYCDGDNKLLADLYFLINMILFEIKDFSLISFLRIPIYFMYYIGVSIFGIYFYLKASNFKCLKRISKLWTSISTH